LVQTAIDEPGSALSKERGFLGCLGCTGVAAIVVLLFPIAAFVGFMAGVLPGLFLAVAPSLFVYMIGWRGLRWLCGRVGAAAGFGATGLRSGRVIDFVAVIPIVAFVIILPMAINSDIEQEASALQLTDKISTGSIDLPDIVAIDLPSRYTRFGDVASCEAICLRLLYNGAVSRVLAVAYDGLARKQVVASYRIERRPQCPDPKLENGFVVWSGERGRGVTAPVRARIAAGDCLIREDGALSEARATISFRQIKSAQSSFQHPWTLKLDTLAALRLEIVTADGRVLYRQTEIRADPLSVPLRTTASGGRSTTSTYVEWSRTRLNRSPLGPDGRDVLPTLLGDAARLPDLPVQ
jgi:hypothetical protein